MCNSENDCHIEGQILFTVIFKTCKNQHNPSSLSGWQSSICYSFSKDVFSVLLLDMVKAPPVEKMT